MATSEVHAKDQGLFEPQALEFPNRVTLELTNHCNLNCVMCPRHHMKGPKGYLAFSLFKRIIDEIVDHRGTALVPFFRGESLLHPDFIAMMTYANDKGIRPIQLATNGTLLTEEVARALLGLELDFVSFSVDSIDPNTYGLIRRGADLTSVLKNIEFFCDLRAQKRLVRPEIQVSVVKTEDTCDGVTEFVRFWQERVDRVRVYEEHSQDGHFGSLTQDQGSDLLKDRRPCLKPFTDMVIYWNGAVALCNHDWDRQEALGNAAKEAIETVWHNGLYEKARESHLGRGTLEKPCSECDHWRTGYDEGGLVGEVYVRDFKAR